MERSSTHFPDAIDRVSVPLRQADALSNEATVLTEHGEFVPDNNIEIQAAGDLLFEGCYTKILHDDLLDDGVDGELPIRLTSESSRSLADVMNNQGSLVARVWGGDAKPLTILSALGHLLLILMLVLAPTYDTGSDQGRSSVGVMVRLIEGDDVTPVEESPGSKDSPASRAALAKRSPLTEEKRPKTEEVPSRDLLEQSSLGLKEVHAIDHVGEDDRQLSRDLNRDKHDDSTPSQKDQRSLSVSNAVRDTLFVESPVSYDSIESAPSSASPERRTNSSAASAGNEYRHKIFSAISEAAYYPKKALQERINGETVVSFTVHKNGALLNVSVCKPSGYEILDNAAITIVRRASQKFPSIPDEVMSESLSYEVPIIFKKRS